MEVVLERGVGEQRRKAKAETHLDFDLDRDRPKHGGWADGRTDKLTQSDRRMTRRPTQVFRNGHNEVTIEPVN